MGHIGMSASVHSELDEVLAVGLPPVDPVNATSGDDVIVVAGDANGISIFGLAAQLNIPGLDVNDRIVIRNNVIEASALSGVNVLTANGGDGDDVLIGSAGNDALTGGADDDVLLGGEGVDVLDGGPVDNTVNSRR